MLADTPWGYIADQRTCERPAPPTENARSRKAPLVPRERAHRSTETAACVLRFTAAVPHPSAWGSRRQTEARRTTRAPASFTTPVSTMRWWMGIRCVDRVQPLAHRVRQVHCLSVGAAAGHDRLHHVQVVLLLLRLLSRRVGRAAVPGSALDLQFPAWGLAGRVGVPGGLDGG